MQPCCISKQNPRYLCNTMAKTAQDHKQPLSDYLGISSATICLIHCLATPVLMSMGVSVHDHAGHDHGWMMLLSHSWDFLFLGIGLFAVAFSARHTSNKSRKALLWGSYLFLVCAVMLEHVGPIFQYLTYGASLALIATHWSNIKAILRRREEEVECVSEGC